MRFQEKQWMPLWVFALLAVFPEVITLPLIVGDPGSLVDDLVPLMIGLFVAALFWVPISRRWIRIDDRFLRLSDRAPIPLANIVNARVVRGKEVKHLRHAMIQGRGLPVAAAALPAVPVAGGALGSIALGVSLLRGPRNGTGLKRGILAEPWMHDAVLAEVPSDEQTPLLLLGTRQPEQLLAALRQ